MNHFPTKKPSTQELSDDSPEKFIRAVIHLADVWDATLVMDESYFSLLLPDHV